MSKLATILLKILLVISFVGIIVFVAIAIFNNLNVSYQAYNHISISFEQNDFKKLSTNVKSKMFVSYNGSIDSYALFIDSAIVELNNGINYYLDYLAIESEITKGEQDKLCSLCDDYSNKYNIAKKTFDEYCELYDSLSYESSDFSKQQLITKNINFDERYLNCYISGSKLLKNLVEITKSYFNIKQDYSGLSYQIKIGLVDYSLNFLFENLNKRYSAQSYESNVRVCDNIDTFYDFVDNCNNFTDEDASSNKNFYNFVDCLNSLNVYSWAGNYENYFLSLNDESLKQKSTDALSFFNANFRE